MPKHPDQPDPAPDYLAPYHRALQTHGPTFEATLWASRPKQIQRFDVLAHALDPTDLTILDAGSGLADFPARLAERAIPYKRCIALEGLPELNAQAAARNIPRTTCVLADFAHDPDAFATHTPDAVYFSGSLNTFQLHDAIPILERAYDAAAVGIAFNFLSARHHQRNPVNPAPAVRYDPLKVLDWALKHTPNVTFRQDYFQGHDATVTLTHPTD